MQNRVGLVACEDYDENNVMKAVGEAVALIGGWQSFIEPGQRVLLKVNLLTERPPEDAVTTHPSVVAAVARQILELGAVPIIYDSPGGPFTKSALDGVYRRSGLLDAAQSVGAAVNWDVGSVEVPTPERAIVSSVLLSRAVMEADLIINLPKLKSHGLTRYTGAVKNLYGCIPGLQKAQYHLQFPALGSFADFLVDVALTVKPALTVMDAVVGMEGDGPSAGTPRQLGYVLASPSVFALDAVAVRLIGLTESEVPTTATARTRGLFGDSADDIVSGLTLREHIVGDFVVPLPGGTSFSILGHKLSPKMLRLIGDWLGPRPVFDAHKCIRCGVCVRSCPANALTLTGAKPNLEPGACIRCFCCQELCPEQAVKVHRPWISKILTS